MEHSLDIAIVGGGVIGLTAAYYLSREGLRVGVFDKQDLGSEASWAGAGILPPANLQKARSPLDRLRALSAEQFPQLSEGLRERTGVDNGYLRCGGLEFVDRAASGTAEEWHGEGVDAQAVTEEDARRLEPAIAPGLGRAVYLPGMAQLRNPRHIKALVSACVASESVFLFPKTPTYRLIANGSRVEAMDTSTGPVRADDFLIAAGAWTAALLDPLGCHLDIQPVRGQIALLSCPAPPIQRILLCSSRYLVPRSDGRVLAGSTEEHAGFDKRTTAEGLRDLLGLACELVPALAQAPLEKSWAGLRPGSPDGLPFLGPVPGYDNLFVAAGHFRAGIQLSPGTATVLKQMILGQPLAIPMDAFLVGRN